MISYSVLNVFNVFKKKKREGIHREGAPLAKRNHSDSADIADRARNPWGNRVRTVREPADILFQFVSGDALDEGCIS